MKIAVVGCGALGCFYGARLCQAGQDVHLLLRSDYEMVRDEGLRVRSADGELRVHPYAHNAPEGIDKCDLVIVGLKTTANDRFAELIVPLLDVGTAILCLQNGLGNCEQLAELFGLERVLGGLCFVCLNRTAPGLVHHIAFGKVVLGELGRTPAERTHEIAGLFKNANVPCEVSGNLEKSQWEKLVWNIPFNGLGVAGAADLQALESAGRNMPSKLAPVMPTDQLLGDLRWEKWVRGLMSEIIAAANAKGLAIDASLEDQMVNYTRDMGEYRASTLVDFERGQPLEMESMFLEPLRQARATGVAIPRLEALCAVLGRLDVRR
ncbi:MAG: 2-dehydropantoate 2-reductase [Verrucomicrobiota bacterium]|nr:2-dehydropantoate 2-reductase [Verrucomicrobiota bacterium]